VTANLKRPPVKTDEQWTVRRIIEWTTAHLEKHGSDTPRLDAEILLAHARGCRRIDLYTRFDDLLSTDERSTMRDLVRRRTKAEPVAYLVGHREFFSLDFRVTPNVLIPRPDTETLVVELLELLQGLDRPRVLDVGTGSGCIAVTAAVNCPSVQVTAVDISLAALEVAQANAHTHKVRERVRLLHGDLFAPLPPNARFDVIASNPPYIREDELGGLQDDVRLHEPHVALVSGADGLEVIRRLIRDASSRLDGGGHLLLEISPEQADSVTSLFESAGDYRDIAIVKDLTGRPRVVRASRM
jgi:release factor glutamine methyltransferase